jgi:hypothetical protein
VPALSQAHVARQYAQSCLLAVISREHAIHFVAEFWKNLLLQVRRSIEPEAQRVTRCRGMSLDGASEVVTL